MSGPCVEPPKQWTSFLKSTMVHYIPHSRTYVPGNHPTPSNTKASRLEDRILTQFTDAIKWHEIVTVIIYCSYILMIHFNCPKTDASLSQYTAHIACKYLLVLARDNTAWVLGIFHGPPTTLAKHRLATCSSLEIVVFAPWLCVLNITLIIISLFVFPVHKLIYNAKIIRENKKDIHVHLFDITVIIRIMLHIVSYIRT